MPQTDTPGDVTHQGSEKQVPLVGQGHGGRPGTPFVCTQRVVRGRRQQKNGSRSPDPFPGVRRGQEAREGDIPQSVFAIFAGKQRRLADERQDGTGDQVPVLVEGEGPDRLDVQRRSKMYRQTFS